MDRTIAPQIPGWLAAMLPFDRYRIGVAGPRCRADHAVEMHVMERGQGRPVLLLHGNPTWGFLNRRVALELDANRYRVIMPDLVGLGLSDFPTSARMHSLDNHITWMANLIASLHVERPILVVQDWGGAIGVGAIARLGLSLSGLVVLNTVLGPPKPGFRPTAFHRIARLPLISDFLFRDLGFPQRGLGFAQGKQNSIRGEVARAYAYPLWSRRTNVAPLALARMVPNDLTHPSVAPLQRVAAFVDQYRGPAEIVWGDRDPVLGKVRNRISRALPQATVVRTQGGHFLQEEMPGPIADAIRHVSEPHVAT